MDIVSDIEIERLLKKNEKLLLAYMGKNRKQIKDYVMSQPENKRLITIKDLIKVAQIHKKTDPDE